MEFAPLIAADRGQPVTSIEAVPVDGYETWLAEQPPRTRAALLAQRFKGKAGTIATVVDERGDGWRAIAAVADPASPWARAAAAERLPEGSYRLTGQALEAPLLGWLLGQ